MSTAPSINVDFFSADSHNYLQAHLSPISRDSSISSSFSGSSFSSSHSDKSPPRRASPPPPLSSFPPSGYTSPDHYPRQHPTRNFIGYDDTSAEETPRPDQSTPRLLTSQSSIPSFVSTERLPPNKLSHNTPLSLSIDMFPTPYGSRAGSEYEPSPPPQTIPRPQHPRRPSREPHQVLSANTKSLHPGSIISACEDDSSASLTLLRTLGQGSFSSVWLACDVSGTLENLVLSRKASIRRLKSTASDGIVRRKSSRRSTGRSNVSGTKPWRTESGTPSSVKNPSPIKNGFDRPDSNEPGGRLVAVKLTDRAIDDRTRVSFIREAEVLRVRHRTFVIPLDED